MTERRAATPRNTGAATDDRLARLRRLAYWLDEGIRLPGTSFRIGLDPIIGLLPGVGDITGAILAGGILVEAVRRGASRFTLSRMAYNIVLDTVFGAIPIVGDAFDVVWKANRRNIELLDRHVAQSKRAGKADRLFVALLGGALILICASLLFAGAFLVARLIRLAAG